MHALLRACPRRSARGRWSPPAGCASRPTCGAAEPRVWADGPRLTQVFWNLLSNAVKFTPPGGTIRRERDRDGCDGDAGRPTLVVEVADTGHRHRARRAAADLRRLRAGAADDHPAVRRPGPGPRHQQGDRRAPRRQPRRRRARARGGARPSPCGCPSLRRCRAGRAPATPPTPAAPAERPLSHPPGRGPRGHRGGHGRPAARARPPGHRGRHRRGGARAAAEPRMPPASTW